MRRRQRQMRREQWNRTAKQSKRKRHTKTSAAELAWSAYMREVRDNARGDSFDPNQKNELFTSNRYDGVVTHPVRYAKTLDYPHGELCAPSSDLLWCERVRA